MTTNELPPHTSPATFPLVVSLPNHEAALNPNVSKRIRAISRAAHVHESSWRTWKLEPRLPGLVPLVVSLPNHDAWQSRAAPCTWLLDKIGPAAAGPARFPLLATL